jgi:hypothetical protein
MCKLIATGIDVLRSERQGRGMFIALDHLNLASSGGATYWHSGITPPELMIKSITKAINIRFHQSRSENIDNNRPKFAHSANKITVISCVEVAPLSKSKYAKLDRKQPRIFGDPANQCRLFGTIPRTPENPWRINFPNVACLNFSSEGEEQ